jgi:adiponectin receptor
MRTKVTNSASRKSSEVVAVVNEQIESSKVTNNLLVALGFKIGSKDDVPKIFHKYYIDYGYRNPSGFLEVLCSVIDLHNETMNIWTHLFGFGCCLYAIILFMMEGDYGSEHQHLVSKSISGIKFDLEWFFLGCFYVSATFTFLFSAIYHWFNCLSSACHDNLLCLDLTGIAFLVAGSFPPAIYYGFYCTPEYQQIYLIMALVILVIGLVAPSIKGNYYHVPIKTCVFALLVCLGLIPSIHWTIITPYEYFNDLYKGNIAMISFLCAHMLFMITIRCSYAICMVWSWVSFLPNMPS